MISILLELAKQFGFGKLWKFRLIQLMKEIATFLRVSTNYPRNSFTVCSAVRHREGLSVVV